MTREDFVKQVKVCGQSIIDNAESIYNNFRFSTEGVKIMIEISSMCVPEITVVNKFMPEGFINTIGMKKEAKQ